MTDKVKTHTHSLKSDVAIIPGGLTSQLQPADVSWNKPFKTAYRKLYNEWMATGEKSFTPAGNMRPPEKALCLEWVKIAWSKVTNDVVIKSFKACGISNNTDGSEDDMIHCLKPGEVAHSTAETVARETAQLNNPVVDDDEDPFMGIDDDDFGVEVEEDETIIDDD